MKGGLDPDAARLLAAAKADGLVPDVVNVMAMDYGVAQTAAQMLADAKRSATGAEVTIRSLGHRAHEVLTAGGSQGKLVSERSRPGSARSAFQAAQAAPTTAS